MIINGNDFIAAPNVLLKRPVFNTYLPFAMRGKLFPVLAVEFNTNGREKISGISVQAATSALECGAAVLGATAFDEKR